MRIKPLGTTRQAHVQRAFMVCYRALCTAVLAAFWVCLGGQEASAQAKLSNADLDSGPYYILPELAGEGMLSFGVEARRSNAPTSVVPYPGYTLKTGYRLYLDDWSELALGLYAVGGGSVATSTTHGLLHHGGLGVSFEKRFMGLNLMYLAVGLYAEVGLAWWSGPDNAGFNGIVEEGEQRPFAEDVVGERVSAGIELTPIGGLVWQEPYVWVEIPITAGYERVDLGLYNWDAVTIGLQLRFGFGHR